DGELRAAADPRRRARLTGDLDLHAAGCEPLLEMEPLRDRREKEDGREKLHAGLRASARSARDIATRTRSSTTVSGVSGCARKTPKHPQVFRRSPRASAAQDHAT